MPAAENTLKQNVLFIRNTFNRSIFPAMLSILSANINVFVDGVLVSNKLGADALAAINLSLPLYLTLCIIGSFFASGTAINAARAMGDNDPEQSQRYYRTCVVSLAAVSVLVMVLGLILQRPLVAFLCRDESIRHYVAEYVVITLIGALPKIMLYIPFWYLRLDGKNAAVAVIMAIMSGGNILLDILFVYSMDMGVFGAGLASVLATTAAFVVGMVWLMSRSCFFTVRAFCFRGRREWRSIAAAGVPSALNNLLAAVRLLIINSVLLRYGGGGEVAVFTAVNGIAGFAECITLGIPQAASPMLGVFSGERDNGSCQLLVRLEMIVGGICSGVFFVLCLGLAEPIRALYGLSRSLFMPLVWLSLSVFPALICTAVSGYYNMARRDLWANALILSRVIVMTYIGLAGVTALKISTYSFLLFAEAATVAVWALLTGMYSRRHRGLTRWLQMDMSLEERGHVLNFSVGADPAEICSASERISAFCEGNGLDTKATMRVQLAMEEIMTLISSVNGPEAARTLCFDLRAYDLDGITGIRIRYNGAEFNPFKGDPDNEDMYMGILMLRKMVTGFYQRTFGVNTLQITLKKVKTADETG